MDLVFGDKRSEEQEERSGYWGDLLCESFYRKEEFLNQIMC
jgi:hypothetical protein